MTKKFVVNPENGFWGIAQESSERELLEVLGSKTLPEKRYMGVHSLI